jgi:enoyl-CoA hydratase
LGISHTIDDAGIAEVVMDNPPVNALTVAGWYELADTITALGDDLNVRVVVLRAEGRGFNAGVDIKEMQQTSRDRGDGAPEQGRFDALIGANRGCFAAFAAVYDCKVPVIAAVHGYCLGSGVSIAGNADIVVAADDAEFGVPEVDRGALGVGTHLARLVPQHKVRMMFYTGQMVTAQELLSYGTVERVVPRDQLMDAAREIAQVIAKKSPLVIRRAKESLNVIEPVDVKRAYRFEQGFTYELQLWGDSDELREAFVEKRDAKLRSSEELQ